MLPSSLLVVEVLTSPNGGAFFWLQQRLSLVFSQSTSFAHASSSSSRRVSRIARQLASPPSS